MPEHGDDDPDQMSYGRFEQLIPAIVRRPTWDENVFQHALWSVENDKRYIRLRGILGWMGQLKALCDRAAELGINHDHTGSISIDNGTDVVWNKPVAALTWLGDDCPMIALLDYHCQCLGEDGRITDIAWAHGFQLGLTDSRLRTGKDEKSRDGSLGAAIESLKLVVRLAVVLDKILTWLDDPALNDRLAVQLRAGFIPTPPVRARVGILAGDVFADAAPINLGVL